MVMFYFMIVSAPQSVPPPSSRAHVCSTQQQAVCAWYYIGQPELEVMLNCPGTVAAALLSEEGGKAEIAPEFTIRMLKTVI